MRLRDGCYRYEDDLDPTKIFEHARPLLGVNNGICHVDRLILLNTIKQVAADPEQNRI
jgi:hypothetical protein